MQRRPAIFGNPVEQAVIRPPGSPVIIGNFRVTAAFGVIDDSHPTPHIGVDIGDGKCGSPVIAMCTGKVSMAGGFYGIVRIVWDDDPSYEVAVAHCVNILVKTGDHVTRGQRIASIGGAGGVPCHGHLGCKHNGVEVDIWPLLDQNQEEDVLLGTNPTRLVNKKVTALGDGTRLRAAPATGDTPILETYPKDTVFYVDYFVHGQPVPAGGADGWFGAWGMVDGVAKFGYLHGSIVSGTSDIIPLTTGFTQEQVNAKVAAAVAPYAARITTMKGKTANTRAKATEIIAISDDIAND